MLFDVSSNVVAPVLVRTPLTLTVPTSCLTAYASHTSSATQTSVLGLHGVLQNGTSGRRSSQSPSSMLWFQATASGTTLSLTMPAIEVTGGSSSRSSMLK